MSEPRPSGFRSGEGRPDERQDDFQALAAVTRRDLPDLATIVGAARRQRAGRRWEERWMSAIRTTKSRPWMATALAGGLAALILLVVPISYDRVTGHEVRLTLADVASDQVPVIARQLKGALGVDGVRVEAEESGSGSQLIFGATVPRNVEAAAIAGAFAASLRAKGYRAEARTHAITERVSTNVYAYAMDRVIEIDLDGKSASQIEAEIRQRFADAGIQDAQVSVTQEESGGRTKLGVRIKAEKVLEPGQTPGAEEPAPQVVLRKGGAPISSEGGLEVKISRLKQNGTETLVGDVVQAGRTAQVRVENAGAMSDAALAAAVQSQLDAAGLEVKVTVVGGRFQIESVE